jgi:hypothetical protein
MKQFYAIAIAFLFLGNLARSQTYAGLPDSSHVLVVYNSLDQTSTDVKNYYKLARGIPAENIVGLTNLS